MYVTVFLNELLELISLHIVKWFWIFLSVGYHPPFSTQWTSPSAVATNTRADLKVKSGSLQEFGKCRARVGYGPAPGPTKKRPCVTLSRSVGRGTYTSTPYRSSLLIQLSGRTSAGRASCGADLAGCVSAAG